MTDPWTELAKHISAQSREAMEEGEPSVLVDHAGHPVAETSGTTTEGHQCGPSRLAGMTAHAAPAGTQVACPCGKTWKVTQNHVGPRGRICGCGWTRIE